MPINVNTREWGLTRSALLAYNGGREVVWHMVSGLDYRKRLRAACGAVLHRDWTRMMVVIAAPRCKKCDHIRWLFDSQLPNGVPPGARTTPLAPQESSEIAPERG